MNSFERDIAQCFNRFFAAKGVHGFAYRLKQSRFAAQYIDVLADSLDPRYYLAIECKSIAGKKLYFSQHFHINKDDLHQIEVISEFLRKTGRQGYIAVEFRFGSGRTKEAYLMSWQDLTAFYQKGPGITLEEFRECITLKKVPEGYHLDEINPK